MKFRLVLVGWAAFVTMFVLINGYMYLMGTLRNVSPFEYFTTLLWSLPVILAVVIIAYYMEKHFNMTRP